MAATNMCLNFTESLVLEYTPVLFPNHLYLMNGLADIKFESSISDEWFGGH